MHPTQTDDIHTRHADTFWEAGDPPVKHAVLQWSMWPVTSPPTGGLQARYADGSQRAAVSRAALRIPYGLW